MRRWKKCVAAALAATMMSTALPIGGMWQCAMVAHAEELTAAYSVSLDWDKEEMIISKKDNSEMAEGDVIYYQVIADKSVKKVLTKQAPNAKKWNTIVVDKVQNGKYVMNINWMTYTKLQTLYVTDNIEDDVEASEVRIDKQNTTLKMKLAGDVAPEGIEGLDYIGDASTGYLSINKTVKNADPAITNLTQLEFRTANSQWQYVTKAKDSGGYTENLKLSKYGTKGVSLYFRVAADQTISPLRPNGKAITFRYAAKATAPKVTVNYENMTLTLPKKCEYISAEQYAQGATWQKRDEKTTKMLYFSELPTEYKGTNAVKLFVRTQGTSKKVSSKVNPICIDPYTEKHSSTNLVVASGIDAIDTSLENQLSMQFATVSKKTSGLSIVNNTDYAYQVAIVKKSAIGESCISEGVYNGTSKWLGLADATPVMKFYNVKKKGTLVIPTGSTSKTNLTNANLDDYYIAYREYDSSVKNHGAPAKIYVTEMAKELPQILTVTYNNEVLDSVTTSSGTAISLLSTGKLDLKAKISNKAKSSDTFTAKVYADEACTKTTLTMLAKVSFDTADSTKCTANIEITSTADVNGKSGYLKVACEGIYQIIPIYSYKKGAISGAAIEAAEEKLNTAFATSSGNSKDLASIIDNENIQVSMTKEGTSEVVNISEKIITINPITEGEKEIVDIILEDNGYKAYYKLTIRILAGSKYSCVFARVGSL